MERVDVAHLLQCVAAVVLVGLGGYVLWRLGLGDTFARGLAGAA